MREILTGYWGKYKNSLILTPIFVLLETVVTLALPTLMSNIVDVGVAGGDRRYIIICGLLMAALALMSAVSGSVPTAIRSASREIHTSSDSTTVLNSTGHSQPKRTFISSRTELRSLKL